MFIGISRRRSHEHSLSRTFVRLFTVIFKKQVKAGELVSKVEIVLCEDEVRLKRVIVV